LKTKLQKRPRIILYDIETSHNVVAVFQLAHNDYINPDNLLQERYVVCASWKELGESKVHSVSTLDNPKRFKANPHDDRHVVETLHSVLSEADVIVAHNGDKYDVRFVAGRGLKHKLGPLPPIVSIDTLKIAKSRFLLNANSLDYLGKYLGVGGKVKTTPGLWLRVLSGDQKAIKEMVDYNKADVQLLEEVFLKLLPYVPNLNRRLFDTVSGCPKCGSENIQRRGEHVAVTRTYQRFHCQDCGGWFKEGKPVGSTSSRNI
jgi:predicted RNA-binding Zn-ribbon protein involved in translation (DUF1610 family)/DNA polymerase elongation subunit (family B)